MRFKASSLILAVCALVALPVAAAAENSDDDWGKAGYRNGFRFESADGRFTLRIAGRLQVRYTYEDPDEGDSSGSFRIRRGRLGLSGTAFEKWNYAVQLELPGSGGTQLLDANLSYRLSPMATLWLGQGKSYFGRQQLNSSGNLHFVDRTITNGRFTPGRQQGIALVGQNESRTFEYNLGLYNGNGINQSRNDNDDYMTVARAVWTPFGAYSPTESAFDYPGSPKLALGVAGMTSTEGAGADAVDVTRLGLELAFKIRGLNMTGEYFTEEADPVAGPSADTDGWYYQLGYLFPGRQHEIAGRYAVISPDSPASSDQVETGIAYSYYMNRHSLKLQTDLRNIEDNALGTDDRELRLQLQLAF